MNISRDILNFYGYTALFKHFNKLFVLIHFTQLNTEQADQYLNYLGNICKSDE